MFVAIDVAVLPPPAIARRAVALSAALPVHQSEGLVLDDEHLPHITLTQQFVPAGELDTLLARIDHVLHDHPPLRLRVTGGARGRSSVWMAVERTAALAALHQRLLNASEAFESPDGDTSAFSGGDARERDVRWVREFRRASSFERFTPHITLGHASQPPLVEPVDFEATAVAACHLGRFCTCRRILRAWDLRK